MAGGGMYSNMGSGMLGLEISLQHQLPQGQTTQNPPHMQPQPPPPPPPHHPIVAFGHHEADQHHHPQPAQLSVKQAYPFSAKAKNQALAPSDDDEPGAGTENSADIDGMRKISPWQRMKWTDNMVRLLIMVVFYIGDEVGSEGNDPAGKKKGAGGVLQKKGKWKSVSRAMMERGFFVSPQQCEDKFNDLNKRYKRVNDILGKGTACRVVENQSLLDTMDHLSAKMKEEVKKLLNSKHLFFREMCAYHNSCGHGGTGGASSSGAAGGGAQQSTEGGGGEPLPQMQQQQRCLHTSENASTAPTLARGEVEGSRMSKGPSFEEENDEDDDDDDDDEEYEDDVVEGGGSGYEHGHPEEDDDTPDERRSRKRRRKGVFLSPLVQQMSTELMNVLQDESRDSAEKRQWIKNRLLQLEEQHVGYQSEAFELEKQRLKWVKFSSKKEREMERDKLGNERLRLENERMMLLIRQKELELLDVYQQQQQQHQSSRKSDPSSITG